VAEVVKRKAGDVESAECFERVFEGWLPMPFRRPWALSRALGHEHVIRVDEYEDGDALSVKGKLSVVDPDKDV
jgi:hypothetical protein